MKRLASLFAVAAVVAVAGCGSDTSSSPLGEGLGYLPKDAPFVVSIDTNLQGSQYKSTRRHPRQVPVRRPDQAEPGDAAAPEQQGLLQR